MSILLFIRSLFCRHDWTGYGGDWRMCWKCKALKNADAAIKDARWGAHNGGAHQLLKLQHATSVELYNALREVSPNHALVLKHYELSPEALSGTGDAAQRELCTQTLKGAGR